MGFWFLGIGALGLVRGSTRAMRSGAFEADAVTWAWIGGSALVLLAGIVLVARAVLRRPR